MKDNEEIWLSDLKEKVESKVEKYTGGRQKPTTRDENIESDWRVW